MSKPIFKNGLRSLLLCFAYLSSSVGLGTEPVDYFNPLNTPLTEVTTVDSLLDYLQRGRKGDAIKSIEDLLRNLPKPLLSTPTFVYRSQSLQEASYADPRTLLSDASGKLVLAFNGSHPQAGYGSVEALEFDPEKAKFIFYELQFNQQGILAKSEANPSRCMTCHRGPDPRPNWESYDQWPGVYGSNDDRLRDEEREPFKLFLTSAETHLRYSALMINPLKSILKGSSYGGRLPQEPNISFTHRMSRNNFHRVARLMMETKDYAKFKYLLAALLSNAGSFGLDLSDFLPPEWRGVLSYYTEAELKEAQAISNSVGEGYSYPSTLLLRSLFETRGISVNDWFLNFKSGLTNTFLNGVSWQGQILEALMQRDPELKRFLREDSNFQLDLVKLADASLGAFKRDYIKLPAVGLLKFMDDPSVPERLWNGSCRQCHETGIARLGPQFGFSEAMKRPHFVEWIQTGKMPVNQRLTPSEKKRLLGVTR